MGKTLLYERIEDLAILVHAEAAPSDEDWDPWVSTMDRFLSAPRVLGLLVVTDAAGPNSGQRAKLDPLYKKIDGGIPTAVMSHARVVRGIVTVLSWFNPKIRAFAPTELTAALAYLGIEPSKREAVLRRIMHMRIELSAPQEAQKIAALTDTVAKMDELMKQRLPKLRSDLERRR
jgi:hypothetical protein